MRETVHARIHTHTHTHKHKHTHKHTNPNTYTHTTPQAGEFPDVCGACFTNGGSAPSDNNDNDNNNNNNNNLSLINVMSFNLFGWSAFPDAGRTQSMIDRINGAVLDGVGVGILGAQELFGNTARMEQVRNISLFVVEITFEGMRLKSIDLALYTICISLPLFLSLSLARSSRAH